MGGARWVVVWRRGVQEETGQGRSGSNFCWGDLDSREKWVSIRQLESETNPLGWEKRRLWKGRF